MHRMGAQQAFQLINRLLQQAQLGLGTSSTWDWAEQQMNLSNFQRAGIGSDCWSSWTTWKFKTRTRTQAQIRQLNNKQHKTAAYEPYGRLWSVWSKVLQD